MKQSKGPLNIGIQGVQASFHDVAARRFFGGQDPEREVVSIECSSFKDLCEALTKKDADFCLMAIENTIAGSILPNYSLLERYDFRVIGEVYLRIEMSIMALPGQEIKDLRFVQSHPMALLQCEDFLFQHPQIVALEASDTAESAKLIAEKKMMGYGAIASSLAAARYGLKLLGEGIETNKQNYTRFLVICRKEDYQVAPHSNKSSLCFETAHEPGSLFTVLEIFKRHKINLTKIQSVPILGKPYQYSIHVDLEWPSSNQHASAFELAKDELEKKTLNVRYFGEYPRGERPSL